MRRDRRDAPRPRRFAPKQWAKKSPCCQDCSAAARADALERAGAPVDDDDVVAELPREDPGAVARRQLEYYFSDANWIRDDYLRNLADAEQSVAAEAFFSFPRIQAVLPSARGLGRFAARTCL